MHVTVPFPRLDVQRVGKKTSWPLAAMVGSLEIPGGKKLKGGATTVPQGVVIFWRNFIVDVFVWKVVFFFAGKKCQYAEFSRWWFQKIFIFTLKLAEDFQFDDFSDGLKPPTSLVYQDGLKLFTMKPYMKELLNQFLLMWCLKQIEPEFGSGK